MLFDLAFPVVFAILLWWVGTGVILILDRRNRASFRGSMFVATVVMAGAFWAVAHFGETQTQFGAYIGFISGLLIWAWLEMSFLLGFITGSRRTPCPPKARGRTRLVMAIETVIHHELAIAVCGMALLTLTWDASNKVATWTFFVLWGMRLSAKINLFLGVRNLSKEFLPDHLGYLGTYFARAPMNPFFPISMGASLAVLVLLFKGIVAPGAAPFDITAHAFLTALMGLAILEHIFMVAPVPLTAIWNWSLRTREASQTTLVTEPGTSPGGKQP